MSSQKEKVYNDFLIPNLEGINESIIEEFSIKKKLFSTILQVNSKFENIYPLIHNVNGKQFYYNLITVLTCLSR